MGFGSFIVGIAKVAAKGSQTVTEVGVTKPHIWQVKQRGLYQGVKALHGLKINETAGSYDMEQAIHDIPISNGLSACWLEKVISTTHRSSTIRTVMAYLKSSAAANLTAYEKAEVWMKCMDKLRYLGVLHGFFD